MQQEAPILQTLNSYLQERFRYRRQVLHYGHTKNILIARRRRLDLHLRFYHYPLRTEPTIVIARIGFVPARKGHGRAFMRFLAELALRYGYAYIELELCNEQSEAFGRQLGFHFADGVERNGRIAVAELVGEFS